MLRSKSPAPFGSTVVAGWHRRQSVLQVSGRVALALACGDAIPEHLTARILGAVGSFNGTSGDDAAQHFQQLGRLDVRNR